MEDKEIILMSGQQVLENMLSYYEDLGIQSALFNKELILSKTAQPHWKFELTHIDGSVILSQLYCVTNNKEEDPRTIDILYRNFTNLLFIELIRRDKHGRQG